MLVLSHFSNVLTLCDSMDYSSPGSSVHGILQARSGLTFPSPGDLSDPGIEPESPAWQDGSLPPHHQGSPEHMVGAQYLLNKCLWGKFSVIGIIESDDW